MYNQMMSKLVCIRTFGQSHEAQIAKNFLRSNGIVADVFLDNFGGYLPGGLHGIELKVRETDKEAALMLLKELEKD